MDEEKPTYKAFAAWAAQSLEEVARDCEVQVFRATGPGGQGVNTTDSAVRMRHVPSGIAVTSRESRSQFQNRACCLRKLHAEFERRSCSPKKRKPTKPTKAARARRLADKRHRARAKERRRRPGADD